MMLAGIPWAITSLLLTEARVLHRNVATVIITVTLTLSIIVPALILVPGTARRRARRRLGGLAARQRVRRRGRPGGHRRSAGGWTPATTPRTSSIRGARWSSRQSQRPPTGLKTTVPSPFTATA